MRFYNHNKIKNKRLRFKYSFLFFIAFSFTLLFLNINKNSEIKSITDLNTLNIKKSYKKIYTQTKEISELIFYNNIINDTKLLELINLQLKENSYEYLKEKFFFYKRYGLNNITINLANNKTFLKMNDNKTNSLTFTKKLYNEKLEYIASVNLSFSLEYISLLMQKDLDYIFVFLLDKKNSYEKANEFLSIFTSKEKQLFLNKINKNEKFVMINDDNSSIYFISVSTILNQEKNISLLALKKAQDKDITLIVFNFYKSLIILFILYFCIFTLLYLLKVNMKKSSSANKKYKDLLNAIDKYVVMVETDTKGIITNVTEAFCNITAYSKKELKGKNINIINHPNMPKKLFKDMWSDLEKGNKWEGELMNLDKYKNSYWVKGSIFPKYNKNKKIVGYSSIRVNTTDKQQLKKINYLLKEDLSNKLNEIRMKDKTLITDTKIELMAKILDSLSYQWKKPISTLFIKLVNLKAHIKKGDFDLNELKIIHKDMEKELKQLSIKLNDFSSFFSNTNKNDKYNVYTALKESINTHNNKLKLNNISIKLDSKKEIYSFGVFYELKYIMNNLIANSIEQITTNNIVDGKINISVINDENEILIKYIDNISAKSKKIIDEVFSDDYDEELNKDIGLNLNIVKLLIEKIGAKIWLENKENSTTFYIRLVSKDRRTNKRL